MWNKKRKVINNMVYCIMFLVLTIAIVKANSINAYLEPGDDKQMAIYDLNTHITDGTIIVNPSTRNGVKTYTYTGKQIKPKFTIATNIKNIDNLTLIEGTHYNIRYPNDSDCINVTPNNKTLKAIIGGKRLITGLESFNYKIVQADIRNAAFSLSSVSYEYDGKEKKPSVTVKYNNMTLKKDKDFTLSYSNNKNAGRATVTVNGKGNFKGSKKLNFEIISYVKTCNISHTSLTLGVNESITVKGTKNPSNGRYKSEYFESSNKAIATVDTRTGKITGKKEGTANIKYKVNNGNKTIESVCKVTVKKAPSSIKLTEGNVTIGVGETFKIFHFTNSGSYANSFSWKIGDGNTYVAGITGRKNNEYTIRGNNEGTTYFRVTTYNGKSATCRITVKSAPSSISLSKNNLTLGVGETYNISHSTNSGSYARNFTWTIDNNKIANVIKRDGNKYTLKGYKAGTTYFRVKTYNGKNVTCKITVKRAPSSISLSKNSLNLETGNSYTISESTDSGSYANAANLQWSSSNSNVASVTKEAGTNKAVINANNIGTAYITVKTYNGKTAICTVNVKEHPIITKAKEIKKYIADNNYEYCLGSANRYSGCEHNYDQHACGLTLNYKDSKKKGKEGYHNTCCATFVSWVLIEAGIVPQSAGSHTADLVAIRNSGKFYEQTSNFKASDIKAGDILIYTDGNYTHAHVEIAARDGATNNRAFVYNAGGYQSIHNEKNGGNSGYTVNGLTVKLRLK